MILKIFDVTFNIKATGISNIKDHISLSGK